MVWCSTASSIEINSQNYAHSYTGCFPSWRWRALPKELLQGSIFKWRNRGRQKRFEVTTQAPSTGTSRRQVSELRALQLRTSLLPAPPCLRSHPPSQTTGQRATCPSDRLNSRVPRHGLTDDSINAVSFF